MHFAAHQHTAAEVVYNRVDAEKPMVGMTNFKGSYITRDDVKIAKNYLSEKELYVLNLLVSQYLDFAELQAIGKATQEFEEYRRKEMLQYESDFDRAIRELTEKNNNNE